MATIDSETSPTLEAPAGAALYVADVPVNATIRLTGLGSFSIVKDANRGIAVPPGDPFLVPLGLCSAFEAAYGPSRGNANVSAEAREHGRIAGLRRVG
jgi:hypothetical protein